MNANFNEGPFMTLSLENPFIDNAPYQGHLFFDEEQQLNDLSLELNKEVRSCSIPLSSESIDNASREECTSIYANHEEDAEDRMLTLDSSEISYEANSIEALVEKEIQQSSLDSLVEECCKSKEVKDPVKNSEKMRFKTTKTPLQLQRLEESLKKYPIKFPKKERKKLAEEIGLEETQVYKWYYDHKPKKASKKSKKVE